MPWHRANLGDRHIPVAEDDGLARRDTGQISGEVSLGRMDIDLDHDCIVD